MVDDLFDLNDPENIEGGKEGTVNTNIGLREGGVSGVYSHVFTKMK